MCENTQLIVRLLQKSEWESILQLSTLPSQSSFIENSRKCLDDAKTNAYNMTWNFYGIFLGENIIGFAMHGRQYLKPLPITRVWLDRFMIDEKYQGKGYGKNAMLLILQKLYTDYDCKKIFLSVIEDNAIAITLYENLGFRRTAHKDPNGEQIMVCTK